MNDGIIRGKILKVTIGPDPKNGLAFMVNQRYRTFEITDIALDKNFLQEHGKEKILIIAKNDQGVEWIWKELVGIPYMLDYFDPKDQPVNHV